MEGLLLMQQTTQSIARIQMEIQSLLGADVCQVRSVNHAIVYEAGEGIHQQLSQEQHFQPRHLADRARIVGDQHEQMHNSR